MRWTISSNARKSPDQNIIKAATIVVKRPVPGSGMGRRGRGDAPATGFGFGIAIASAAAAVNLKGLTGPFPESRACGKRGLSSGESVARTSRLAVCYGGIERGAIFMSDDRKDELPPFVQNDDSATMIANFAARRRRAYAAALNYSGSGPIMPLPLQGEGRFTADARILPDWTALRAELIGRLDAIEAGFQKIRPFLEFVEAAYRESGGQIGHDKPPEPIDILPINAEELEIGANASELARSELKAEHPRFDVIRLCVRVLKLIRTKVNIFLDEFLKESGKRTVQVVAATALFQELDVNLHDVVTKIHRVFELLHLTF
jgi:hypothetical protein